MSVSEHLKNPVRLPLLIAVDICERLRILDISESSSWFVDLVAARIADTGKHVDDLTVRELRGIIEECRDGSNAAAKKNLFWWKRR